MDLGGEIIVRFLISVCGILMVFKLFDIDGVDLFEGVIMYIVCWDYI